MDCKKPDNLIHYPNPENPKVGSMICNSCRHKREVNIKCPKGGYNKNLFRDWLQSQKLDEDMSLPAALRHVVDFGCHKYQTLPITGNKDGSTKISTDILVKFMSNLTAQTLKPADAIEKFLAGAIILPCQQSDSNTRSVGTTRGEACRTS